jgi:hypothetical protein
MTAVLIRVQSTKADRPRLSTLWGFAALIKDGKIASRSKARNSSSMDAPAAVGADGTLMYPPGSNRQPWHRRMAPLWRHGAARTLEATPQALALPRERVLWDLL